MIVIYTCPHCGNQLEVEEADSYNPGLAAADIVNGDYVVEAPCGSESCEES